MTVATALATPMDVATSPMYTLLHADRHHTLAWLTERRDIHERREDRLETVEWAILVWVVLGVIADIILVIRGP